MNTLQGIFDTNRSTSKRNFIQENVRQLRSMRKLRNNKESTVEPPRRSNKFQHVMARVPVHVTASSSRERETPSSQAVGRSRSSIVPTRTSINSTLSTVQSADLQNSRSGQRLPMRSALSRKSRIYPAFAGNESSAREIDVSRQEHEKQLKNSAASSLKTANSVTKSLSAMSLSSSLDVTKDGSDTVHRTVSENSIPIEPIRSLGCQTVSPEDMDGMFNDGVIKYPSTCHLEEVRGESTCKTTRPLTRDSTQQTESSPLQLPALAAVETNSTHTRPISINNVIPSPLLHDIQQVAQPEHERLLQRFKGTSIGGSQVASALNYRANISKDKNENDRPPVLRRHRMGQDKERPRNGLHVQPSDFDKAPPRSHESFDPSCPPGHMPLPDSERLETLRILQKSYEDHIRQLNLLPVKTDTLKMRLRKADIEKQLNKLEEGIKMFSRPKVFVKIGA